MKSLAGITRFEAKLTEMRKPVVQSRVGFKLDEPGLLAAGMAFDATHADFYIASVRGRKVLRRAKNGIVSDFVREGQDGFLAGAGLAIDAPRFVRIAFETKSVTRRSETATMAAVRNPFCST